MCNVMQKLKSIENQARLDCKAQNEYELQAVYGQHALEVKRMQKIHRERCEACQDQEGPDSEIVGQLGVALKGVKKGNGK